MVLELPQDTTVRPLTVQAEIARKAANDEANDRLGKFSQVQVEINKATNGATEQKWVDHLRRNRKVIRSCGDASHALRGRCGPNIGAVVVGASPSLRRNYTALHDLDRESAIIVCVNSALPFLLEKGIKPDIVCAVDADEWVATNWAGVGQTDIHLICSTLVHPRTIAEWLGPKSFFWYQLSSVSDREQRRWIQKTDEQGRKHFATPFPAMGNVFNMAVAASVIVMYSQSLIMVGNELSWTTETVQHVYDEEEKVDGEKGIAVAIANNGDEVRTTHVMWLYKLLLEHLLTQFPVNVINASEGGIFGINENGALPNVKHYSLKNAVALWNRVYGDWRKACRKSLEPSLALTRKCAAPSSVTACGGEST